MNSDGIMIYLTANETLGPRMLLLLLMVIVVLGHVRTVVMILYSILIVEFLDHS